MLKFITFWSIRKYTFYITNKRIRTGWTIAARFHALTLISLLLNHFFLLLKFCQQQTSVLLNPGFQSCNKILIMYTIKHKWYLRRNTSQHVFYNTSTSVLVLFYSFKYIIHFFLPLSKSGQHFKNTAKRNFVNIFSFAKLFSFWCNFLILNFISVLPIQMTLQNYLEGAFI